MTIDSYTFGEMIIDGEKYSKDVIVYPDHVFSPWWREDGHDVVPQDIPAEVLEGKPECIVIGRGHSKKMRVSKEAQQVLAECGAEVLLYSTRKAWKSYNKQIAAGKAAIGMFHLTC